MILLKNPLNASTRLSMNGKSPMISTAPPFVLRLSKDERKVFQQNRNIASHKEITRGTRFAGLSVMIFQCQHCGQAISGKMFRVRSEESGVTLLDIRVCHYCYIDAKRLGLDVKEMRTPDTSARSRSAHSNYLT